MNLIDLEFAAHDTSCAHKTLLMRYNAQLNATERAEKEKLLSIYLSSNQGPVVVSMIFLAMTDLAAFLRFSTYTHDVASDAAEAVESLTLRVGNKWQTALSVASLRVYAARLQYSGMEVAACPKFDVDVVLDYVSVLICFLHLYRCCLAPDDVLDDFDDTLVRGWMATCGIPLMKPLKIEQVTFH